MAEFYQKVLDFFSGIGSFLTNMQQDMKVAHGMGRGMKEFVIDLGMPDFLAPYIALFVIIALIKIVLDML